MIELLKNFWMFCQEAAPFLLMGLFVAGLVHQFINVTMIQRHLGNGKLSSVFKAAILGVPLPLCSCSVIPAAVTLKKQGASNGATSAFLIATPESGIDSISITYAMMDLPMTIIRPVAAFLSAFLAGGINHYKNDFKGETEIDSCCAKKKAEEQKVPSCCVKKKEASFSGRFMKAVHFAYFDLIDDIATWLLIGLFAGALITTLVPMELIQTANGTTGRLLILAIGIPLYICASASTPIAAGLMLKGLSPGTALILLLVGPATNISNIAVLQKYIGRKGVIINILSIGLVALLLSYVVDALYLKMGWPLPLSGGGSMEEQGTLWQSIAAGILLILLVKGVYKEKFKKGSH